MLRPRRERRQACVQTGKNAGVGGMTSTTQQGQAHNECSQLSSGARRQVHTKQVLCSALRAQCMQGRSIWHACSMAEVRRRRGEEGGGECARWARHTKQGHPWTSATRRQVQRGARLWQCLAFSEPQAFRNQANTERTTTRHSPSQTQSTTHHTCTARSSWQPARSPPQQAAVRGEHQWRPHRRD